MKINITKLLILFLIILSLGLYYLVFVLPIPKYKQELEIVEIDRNPNIFEGKKMALAICKSCHYDTKLDRLSGIKHGNPTKFGELFSANITKDSTFGIGSWTDKELAYFLKTGVRKDGVFIFDMPNYNYLSDKDISSIIAFLRSDDDLVKPVPSRPGITEYSVLSKLMMKIILKPQKYNKHIESIERRETIKFGKYLATVKYSCANCHSGNSMTYNNRFPEKSWRYFKGGNPHYDEVNNKVITPSLRPISKYSRNEFTKILQTGYKTNGSMLRRPMIPFNMLDSVEINSIYSYLLTLDQNEYRN